MPEQFPMIQFGSWFVQDQSKIFVPSFIILFSRIKDWRPFSLPVAVDHIHKVGFVCGCAGNIYSNTGKFQCLRVSAICDEPIYPTGLSKLLKVGHGDLISWSRNQQEDVLQHAQCRVL